MLRRLIDVFVAGFGIIFFAPLLMVVAVLIKFEYGGPILYIPQMIGLNGREFFMFRFRTMSMQGNTSTEQRLTRVGRFIRNYSLDHLPMLFNLLIGDLTLVGPRPIESNAVNMNDPIWQSYFSFKPGLFNYAVLKLGKAWTPARESNPKLNQELELEYLQKRSALSDLKLFLKFLITFILSRGNVKARGQIDKDLKK